MFCMYLRNLVMENPPTYLCSLLVDLSGVSQVYRIELNTKGFFFRIDFEQRKKYSVKNRVEVKIAS